MKDNRVFLVSCVAAKAATPQPARTLYVSDWFAKARAYVEATGRPWFILSALHGIVRPGRVVEPYDFTWRKDDPTDPDDRVRRQTWGRITASNLRDCAPETARLVILAGADYREFLVPALKCRGFAVEVPMAGMGIGQQKQWLLAHTPSPIEQLSLLEGIV
jgi:hypothetical protein